MILPMKWNPLENVGNLIGNTKKLYPFFRQKNMDTLLIHKMYNMKETSVLQLVLQLNLWVAINNHNSCHFYPMNVVKQFAIIAPNNPRSY
jgi:hypothetical protein